MVPAVLVIFGLHSYTTGMYLLHYLYFRARDPICKSIEFDLIYIVAFISFFLAFPLALASRIGVSVLQELHEQEKLPFFSDRFAAHFRGSIKFIFVFLGLHSFVMPLLLRIPLGQPLWVEHNFARNVLFLSIIVVLIGVPLQLVQALAFSMRSKPLTYSISLLQIPRRSFPLLIGIPLGAIAFWLISSFLALSVFESATYIFGNVSTPGIESTMTLCSVLVLGFALAVRAAGRLGIWRCSLRALMVIILATIASQLSHSLAFPINWFEVCVIWTD